ncbi:hypothetical protein [Paenibacillus sp. MABNR03]|uniref:hypothetical protein n=1 Tax=Paenibacillus sp. MABNR03 TaxID=3142626 RepID=UPI003D2CA058
MNPEWESKVREFTLNESQMDFVFLPSKALDFFRNEDCVPVVFLLGEEPVGFFVLHNSEEVYDFTDSDKLIFLRAFSIDRKNQRKGYATLADSSIISKS